jgi:hypothetical protein
MEAKSFLFSCAISPPLRRVFNFVQGAPKRIHACPDAIDYCHEGKVIVKMSCLIHAIAV